MIKPANVLLWVCLAACGEQVGGLLHGSEPAEVVEISGDVVSRVDGSAIGTREVERLAQFGNLPPTAALERLQAERLLGQEAKNRGYEQRTQTVITARQALVQELLIEAVESVEVDQAELDKAYQAQKSRFDQPEKRRATHVLFTPDSSAGLAAEQAAADYAQQTLRSLLYAVDVEAALAAARGASAPHVKVSVQDLPAAADDGTYVPEFSRALFSVPAAGVVPDVVKTEFGYHVILVREIVPAHKEPQSVAVETLRREIAARKQAQRLDGLLRELRKRTPVKYAPDAQKILAALDF